MSAIGAVSSSLSPRKPLKGDQHQQNEGVPTYVLRVNSNEDKRQRGFSDMGKDDKQ